MVQSVDVPGHTIYFTDGRTLVLDRSDHFWLNGREISLREVMPGWTVVKQASTFQERQCRSHRRRTGRRVSRKEARPGSAAFKQAENT